MITIQIPPSEWFNEETNEILPIEKKEIVMEHSLVSLRDWEAKWKIPFLHTEKNVDQLLDYLKLMTLTPNVPDVYYRAIPPEEMKRIGDYIKDSETAMRISNRALNGVKKSNELVTAETIYWWMITLNIPPEYETWHLERLLALIRFVSIKNDPKKKKMSQKDVIRRNAEINAKNRERLGISG